MFALLKSLLASARDERGQYDPVQLLVFLIVLLVVVFLVVYIVNHT